MKIVPSLTFRLCYLALWLLVSTASLSGWSHGQEQATANKDKTAAVPRSTLDRKVLELNHRPEIPTYLTENELWITRSGKLFWGRLVDACSYTMVRIDGPKGEQLSLEIDEMSEQSLAKACKAFRFDITSLKYLQSTLGMAIPKRNYTIDGIVIKDAILLKSNLANTDLPILAISDENSSRYYAVTTKAFPAEFATEIEAALKSVELPRVIKFNFEDQLVRFSKDIFADDADEYFIKSQPINIRISKAAFSPDLQTLINSALKARLAEGTPASTAETETRICLRSRNRDSFIYVNTKMLLNPDPRNAQGRFHFPRGSIVLGDPLTGSQATLSDLVAHTQEEDSAYFFSVLGQMAEKDERFRHLLASTQKEREALDMQKPQRLAFPWKTIKNNQGSSLFLQPLEAIDDASCVVRSSDFTSGILEYRFLASDSVDLLRKTLHENAPIKIVRINAKQQLPKLQLIGAQPKSWFEPDTSKLPRLEGKTSLISGKRMSLSGQLVEMELPVTDSESMVQATLVEYVRRGNPVPIPWCIHLVPASERTSIANELAKQESFQDYKRLIQELPSIAKMRDSDTLGSFNNMEGIFHKLGSIFVGIDSDQQAIFINERAVSQQVRDAFNEATDIRKKLSGHYLEIGVTDRWWIDALVTPSCYCALLDRQRQSRLRLSETSNIGEKEIDLLINNSPGKLQKKMLSDLDWKMLRVVRSLSRSRSTIDTQERLEKLWKELASAPETDLPSDQDIAARKAAREQRQNRSKAKSNDIASGESSDRMRKPDAAPQDNEPPNKQDVFETWQFSESRNGFKGNILGETRDGFIFELVGSGKTKVLVFDFQLNNESLERARSILANKPAAPLEDLAKTPFRYIENRKTRLAEIAKRVIAANLDTITYESGFIIQLDESQKQIPTIVNRTDLPPALAYELIGAFEREKLGIERDYALSKELAKPLLPNELLKSIPKVNSNFQSIIDSLQYKVPHALDGEMLDITADAIVGAIDKNGKQLIAKTNQAWCLIDIEAKTTKALDFDNEDISPCWFFSDNNRIAYCWSKAGLTRIDLGNLKKASLWKPEPNAVAVEISNDGFHVVMLLDNGDLHVFSLANETVTEITPLYPSKFSIAANHIPSPKLIVCSDGSSAIVSTGDSHFKVLFSEPAVAKAISIESGSGTSALRLLNYSPIVSLFGDKTAPGISAFINGQATWNLFAFANCKKAWVDEHDKETDWQAVLTPIKLPNLDESNPYFMIFEAATGYVGWVEGEWSERNRRSGDGRIWAIQNSKQKWQCIRLPDGGSLLNSQIKHLANEVVKTRDLGQIEAVGATLRDGRFVKLDGKHEGLFNRYLSALSEAVFELDWIHGGDMNQRYRLRLERWLKAFPKAITIGCLATTDEVARAWKARGDGFANEVSEDGMIRFMEGMDRAKMRVMQMVSTNDLPAIAASQIVAIMKAIQFDRTVFDKFVDHVMNSSANSSANFHLEAVQALLPRWHGAPGDCESYMQRVADELGKPDGPKLYAQMACMLARFHNRNIPIQNQLDIDLDLVASGAEEAIAVQDRYDLTVEVLPMLQLSGRFDLIQRVLAKSNSSRHCILFSNLEALSSLLKIATEPDMNPDFKQPVPQINR